MLDIYMFFLLHIKIMFMAIIICFPFRQRLIGRSIPEEEACPVRCHFTFSLFKKFIFTFTFSNNFCSICICFNISLLDRKLLLFAPKTLRVSCHFTFITFTFPCGLFINFTDLSNYQRL